MVTTSLICMNKEILSFYKRNISIFVLQHVWVYDLFN
jgi:hypothetical protein